jgi:hypothetical protein
MLSTVATIVCVAALAQAARFFWKAHRGTLIKTPVRDPRREEFLAAMAYHPCTLDPLGRGRKGLGVTTGMPPSIETDEMGGWLCPGLLGVPV